MIPTTDLLANTQSEGNIVGWYAGTAIPDECETRTRPAKQRMAFQRVLLQAGTFEGQNIVEWLEANSSTEDIWREYAVRIIEFPQLDDIAGEASTNITVHEGDDKLADNVRLMFAAALDEHFEDGMKSQFSEQLTRLIANNISAIDYVINLIVGDQVNDEVAAEALRWIGQMGQHQQSYENRRWLLERCLFSASLTIRDGALLGLSFLNDPRTIGSLQKALKLESSQMLAEDMAQVICDLS